jgi:ribosomal-protein-alanine N-acetyltransferase
LFFIEELGENMLTLETERLSLRGFSMKDWDALNAIISDPEVTRFMHFASWDEEKRREWFTRLVQDVGNQKRYNWAITLRSNGILIGWFFIGGTEEGTKGCGYALNRRFWGQGYMPEAVQTVFAHEFTVLGTLRIFAECEVQNTASARVMQKSGMIYEGTFYNADFEGNWAMRHRYAISKQNWEVVSGAKVTPDE